MRRHSRRYPIRTAAIRSALALTLVAAAGCGTHTNPARVDLIAGLPQAERRAAKPVEQIRVATIGEGANAREAMLMTSPARVIWSTRMPFHARLRTAVALLPDAGGHLGPGVTARIGISDNRVYEPLFLLKIEAASGPAEAAPAIEWHPVDINMGAYAGWQWSVFYHPTDIVWRLVFNADITPGGTIAWARPVIE